jgi:hypothetical protein
MAELYQDPTLMKVIEMLNQSGPVKLKNKYSIGDPIVVSQGALPRCFIQYDRTVVGFSDMSTLLKTKSILLNVVLDMKRDLNNPITDVLNFNELADIVMGEDKNYKLRENVIVGALLSQDFGELAIDLSNNVEVEYGIGVERRGKGIVTAEALVRFSLIHRQSL